MKSVVWWSIGLLCGLGLMAIGLFGTVGSDIVLCGSERMQPGQICESTQYGQKSSKSYEEKLQESIDADRAFQNGGRWVTFGIGAGIAAACGWRLTVAIRRRVRQGSGGAGVPGQQVGFGTPPGVAPQGEFSSQGVPVGQDYPQQQGFQQPGFQQQPGFAPREEFAPQGRNFSQQPGFQQQGFAPQGEFPQQGVSAQQDFPPQPGFQQQPGFAPPQGFQQSPPPAYQPPQGPYQQ